eukprot:20222-Heterococcus_DN1.PRE.1
MQYFDVPVWLLIPAHCVRNRLFNMIADMISKQVLAGHENSSYGNKSHHQTAQLQPNVMISANKHIHSLQ